MCGATGYSVKDPKEIYDRFEVENTLENFKPRWNTRPGGMHPVIYMTADGVQIKYMYWTFVPTWAPEKRIKFSTFNARDDRLMESRLYKPAIPSQRCIIPVTHFYEPDRVHFPKPQPAPWYLFKLKEETVFGLAGLYNVWTDPKTKGKLFTYTIITTKPNAAVGAYHDREPARLPKNEYIQWLNPDMTEPQQVMEMIKTSPPDDMVSWRVGDEAKNPRNDYPELIKPL